MKSLSLNTRLFVYSMIFCFAGVVLVGVYSFYSARSALVSRTFQQLTSLREEKKERIQSFFHDRQRDINLLVNDKNALEILRMYSKVDPFRKNEEKSIDKCGILDHISSSNAYSSISIYSLGGRTISAKIDHNANLVGFQETVHQIDVFDSLLRNENDNQVTIVDFIRDPITNNYFIYIASPIKKVGNNKTELLLLEIPESTINLITSKLTDLDVHGKTGEIYLVGSDYLMRSSSKFYDKSVLSVECKSEPVEKAVKGESGISKTLDYRDRTVLSSFSPIKIANLNWVILAEMDWDEAILQISILGKRILLIGFIVFVILTIGVYILSKRITAPLHRLKEAASRVGEGDFEQILPISLNNDEIGHLTQVFNRMTLQLKHTTNRLKEREQRLTHFYKATVDGIILHKTGSPVLVNHALSNLTGYCEDELIKKNPDEYLIVQEDILLTLQHKTNVSFEATLKNKSGQKLPVEVQKSKVQYHGQEVESLVIRDISRRKAIEEELQTERLRQMRSVIDGQEQERQRLSRELHDGLGQTLVAIKLKLESIPIDEVGHQRKTLESVKQMFNHTIEEIRRMSNNLMPAALTEFSLAVVLRNLCTEVESNSGINVSLVIGVLPDSLSQILKTYIYRIVQEALNNVVKHSGASRAVVSIFSDISKLYLHVEDNGVGFDSSRGFESGNGLYNMKERAILLNGKFEIVSSKEKGVKIQAEFPLYPKTRN